MSTRIRIPVLCAVIICCAAAPAMAGDLNDMIRKASNTYDARSDIRSNRFDAIAAQIASGNGINEANQNGDTPLKTAASNNDVEITMLLLEKGADAYAVDSNKMSVMANSIIFGKQTFHTLLDYYSKKGRYPDDFDKYNGNSSVMDRAFSDNSTGSGAFELLLAYDVSFPAEFVKHAEWEVHQYPSAQKQERLKKLQEHLAKKLRGEKMPPPPAPPQPQLLPPEDDTSLVVAVKSGNIDEVRRLLAAGETPDQISAYYNDGVFSKVMGGGREAAKLAGRPALSLALLQDHGDIAQLLLDKGANPNLRGANYANYGQDSCETPLILAVKNNDKGMIAALLAKGADVNRPDCQWGKVPVAYTHDKTLIDLLLEKGADLNRGGNYTFVLNEAFQSKDKAQFAYLLDKGADANHVSPGAAGETLLHKVAGDKAYDGSYIDMLLAHGADVNIRNDQGMTPYDAAIAHGRPDIAAQLQKAGAASGDQKKVMMEAIGRGDVQTMETVLKGGLDPKGQSYALSAAYSYYPPKPEGAVLEMLRLLDKYGADLKTTGENGKSLMHMAQEGAVVDFLFSKGVDVNAVNQQRQTPLHVAAGAANVSVVEALLKNGADPTMLDSSERSPLGVAMEGPTNRVMADGPPTDWAKESPPYFDVIRLLANHGADPNSGLGTNGGWSYGKGNEDYEEFRTEAMKIATEAYKPRAATPPVSAKHVVAAAVPVKDAFILFRMVSERFINKNDAVKWQTGKDPAALCNIDVMAAARLLYEANKGFAPDFASFLNTLRLRGQMTYRNVDGTDTMPHSTFQGPNLLQMAVFYKDLPLIKALLAAGADVKLPDDAGNTALHYATEGYSLDPNDTKELIGLLIGKGIDVNARNTEGETALLKTDFSTIGGKMMTTAQLEIVEQLLAAGADPKVTRYDGYSLADQLYATQHRLSEMKETEYVKAQSDAYSQLLAKLAAQGVARDKWRQNTPRQERTPFQEAVERLDVEAATKLIAEGADVNAGINGYTPFVTAVSTGDQGLPMAKLLLAHGATADVRFRGGTLYSKAMLQTEHAQMVDLLLASGVKPVSADLLGFYSDYLTQGGKSALRKVLDGGADPNACDSSGESPLYKAAMRNNVEAVEILLSYGARLDFCSKNPAEAGHAKPAIEKLFASAASATGESASIMPELEKLWYAPTECRIRDKPE